MMTMVDARIDEEESVLQSAVWLVQDLGVAMPPVPDIHAEALSEIVLGRVFATAPALANLQTREAVVEAVATGGWPPGGLALGFMSSGSGGRWFYVLVGEQQILLLSIRVSFYTEMAAAAGRAAISYGNGLVERHLADPANVARALAGTGSAVRRVATYSNELGLPVEMRALWTAEDGLGDFEASFEVFTPEQAPVSGGFGLMIRV